MATMSKAMSRSFSKPDETAEKGGGTIGPAYRIRAADLNVF